jgi:uncharacterized protein YjbJ (UPF0337 family)
MNTDQLAGKWKQMKGSVKQQWGKLTDDDIEFINGKAESLVGKIQERYGIAKEDAQKRADEWLRAQGDTQHASTGAMHQGGQHQTSAQQATANQGGGQHQSGHNEGNQGNQQNQGGQKGQQDQGHKQR